MERRKGERQKEDGHAHTILAIFPKSGGCLGVRQRPKEGLTAGQISVW